MTDEEKQRLADRIDCEGFEWVIRNCSFKSFNDKDLERLVEKWRDVTEAIEEYIELDKMLEQLD